jgi:tRNA (mo5U34)-methyltransferase
VIQYRQEYKMEGITLKEEVSEIKWFHSIDLGGGVITPGCDNSSKKLASLHLPKDLSGKSVLDVGAWDGFFSFEAEKRNAKRVLATDSFVWEGKTWGSKKGFNLAKKTLKSQVEEKMIDVMDISPQTVGTFDVVMFLGVLYHVRHPLEALENISSVTDEMLVLETFSDLHWLARPAMAFYPTKSLEGDETNMWGPNPAAVKEMLFDVGFREVKQVYSHPIWFRLGRAAKLSIRGYPLIHGLNQSRIVLHAYK